MSFRHPNDPHPFDSIPPHYTDEIKDWWLKGYYDGEEGRYNPTINYEDGPDKVDAYNLGHTQGTAVARRWVAYERAAGLSC